MLALHGNDAIPQIEAKRARVKSPKPHVYKRRQSCFARKTTEYSGLLIASVQLRKTAITLSTLLVDCLRRVHKKSSHPMREGMAALVGHAKSEAGQCSMATRASTATVSIDQFEEGSNAEEAFLLKT